MYKIEDVGGITKENCLIELRDGYDAKWNDDCAQVKFREA